MISRILKKSLQQSPKSLLLLGPRQVGKSTLIAELKPELSINLADEMEWLRFSSQASELRFLIEREAPRTVAIDEIQRLPQLLNTVQALADENKKLKFLLTGSSARKLKSGGANLLPGRVFNYNLGPFCSAEFDHKMDTRRCLEYGSLPEVYLMKSDAHRQKLLKSYSASYLREEIKAEALVRNLESFSRFLQASVLSCGQFVDYSKLAKTAKISRHACPRYFEILEDTMVGQRVLPFFTEKLDIDLIKHPKFYFFDNGVYNGLLGNYTASPDRIGPLAEQLVFSQLVHSASAFDQQIEISTFRMRSGEEVDFIVKTKGSIFAIEVKNSDDLSASDFQGLDCFAKTFPKTKAQYVFHMGTKEKKYGKIWVLPWQKGLAELGF
jgi:predicted AAA+ superfamily ATPase